MAKKKNIQKRKRHRDRDQRRYKTSLKQMGKDLCVAVFFGLGSTLIVCSFFFSLMKVTGYGMSPTVRNGEYVLVKKTKEVRRFDLVAFNNGSGKRQIRRIIGLPGESISFKEDELFVNGQPMDEKFIVDEVNESQRNGKNYTEDFTLGSFLIEKGTIPAGYYFVLGDNRPYATDSRHYGLVSKEKVIGFVYNSR
ncbi:signal peptidase I [Enterococcus haemoperoxidus]